MGDYRPEEYWRRLHRRGDLSAVGQSGLPHAMNKWLYLTVERNLGTFLEHAGVGVPDRVFDVGAGLGYWVEYWLRRGAERVDGCDLVPAAVGNLQERFGASGSYRTADIADFDSAGSTYPLVSCMNVLLHIVDEQRFRQALANVAGLVGNGGHLLIDEPILFDGSFARHGRSHPSSLARPLPSYAEPLEQSGLTLVTTAPATALASNPIEGRSQMALRAWSLLWHGLTVPSRVIPIDKVTGPLIYHLDPIFLRAGASPASKFALFVRSSGS